MNKERRVRLQVLRDELEDLAREEEAAFNNLPESLQDAPNGQILEANADALQEAVETLDGVLAG